MPPSDDPVEIEVTFDEGTLTRIDRLRHRSEYETRSEVVTAAIEAATE